MYSMYSFELDDKYRVLQYQKDFNFGRYTWSGVREPALACRKVWMPSLVGEIALGGIPKVSRMTVLLALTILFKTAAISALWLKVSCCAEYAWTALFITRSEKSLYKWTLPWLERIWQESWYHCYLKTSLQTWEILASSLLGSFFVAVGAPLTINMEDKMQIIISSNKVSLAISVKTLLNDWKATLVET